MPSKIAAVALGALLVLVYLRSPIDLLPDRIGPLGLIDDLVVVAVGLWWLRRRWRAGEHGGSRRDDGRRSAAGTDRGGGDWDPYRVLGVAPGASREDITRAYREQLKLYHPDRVASLGEELRQLAHRKVLDIRRAYDEIAGAARPST